MTEKKADRIKREEREKIEDLRPMSRLKFQILYGKCASSGWVYGEFNETLYQQYLQRYGFFLCHLLFLKNKKIDEDGLLTKLSEKSDIYFLIDTSRLIHTISLPGTTQFYDPSINIDSKNIKWFFAESPNTLETYVYNPNGDSTPYYTGPLKILETETATGVGKKTVQKQNWINQNIILLDFFPFPIIMSTDIRKDVRKKGYTFRKHLSEYFKPLFINVKEVLENDKKKTLTEVYLISPPYTSIHAIFELEDFEWINFIKLKNESNHKINKTAPRFGFDEEKTPEKIFDGFIEIRKNEFDEFLNKFSLTTTLSLKINPEIPLPKSNYLNFCSYLKKRIYLNDGNVPGIVE